MIDKSYIKERLPFYLKCFRCGKMLEGLTKKAVIHEAESDGWTVVDDEVLCGNCANDVLDKSYKKTIEEVKE
jgi:uncharacterized CHY-type Zn-finger protein